MTNKDVTDRPFDGPVTPPSLGEIYEISSRRQRTRYRFIQGTLAAVAVAGVGIGLRGRAPVSEAADQAPTIQSTEETTTSTVVPPAVETTLAPPDWANLDCFLRPEPEDLAPWITEGQAIPLVDRDVLAEAEALSDAWRIPFDEVKALIGLAGRTGVTLEPDTIDYALEQWGVDGYTGEQLAELADSWNVSSISIKVLQFIGDPAIQAALVDCGLPETQG